MAAHLRAAVKTSAAPLLATDASPKLAPKLVTAATLNGTFDAILLTVKAFALDAALDDLAPAVGPDTMILPVLNGMRHVDTLIERFGRHALVGCACKVATIVDEQGRRCGPSEVGELVIRGTSLMLGYWKRPDATAAVLRDG